MKVFEVGLVCDFEGGSGVLIADNEYLFNHCQIRLLGVLSKHLKDMELLYSDNANDYEIRKINALRKECRWTQERISKAQDVDALRRITMDESNMRVMIQDREVLGGEK